MIDPGHSRLSIVRQCELVSISRSLFYREPTPESGIYYVTAGALGAHRVRRLMTRMGLAPIYQRPKTSEPHPQHKIYPYLLRHPAIDRPNQVWCADITYIQMRRGFLYLVAIMDWASRKVVAWRLSNTMDTEFCVAALEEAIARYGRRDIFNTDSQKIRASSRMV